VVPYLFWSANVSAAVRRYHVANRVTGNQHPLAVHLDFVMVADHPTLGRAAIRQAAARTLAVISSELRIEVPMPFIVADPVLRACACTKDLREAWNVRYQTVIRILMSPVGLRSVSLPPIPPISDLMLDAITLKLVILAAARHAAVRCHASRYAYSAPAPRAATLPRSRVSR
jgi:hypothetical protein